MPYEFRLDIRPELKQEQRLDQRLELEQRLEQKLEQQVKLEQTRERYLQQEDIIQKMIRWADKHNSWVNFNKEGFNFKYGSLPYSVAEPIADMVGPGFAHCMYEPFEVLINGRKVALARGDWTLFVVKDMVPQDLIDFFAIHERGEELSLGNHYFASQLEFALARKQGKLKKHIDFTDRECPSKFIDLTQKIMFPILPKDLFLYISKYKGRNTEELARAEELIEQHPLPTIVLRLMDKYEATTQRVCDLIKELISPVQNQIYKLFTKKKASAKEIAEMINDTLSRTLSSIDPEDARVISRSRANEMMVHFSNIVPQGIYNYFGKHIVIENDFATAYKKALNRKELARVKN